MGTEGDGKELVEVVRGLLVAESVQYMVVVEVGALYMEVVMVVGVNGQEEGENKQELVGAVVISMDKLEVVVNVEEAAVNVGEEVGNFVVVVVGVSCRDKLVVVERTMEEEVGNFVAVVVNLVGEEVGNAHSMEVLVMEM